MKKSLLILIAILVATIAFSACSAGAKPLTVFLVRHVEDFDAGSDPKLTDAGVERAAALARNLADAGIQRIHSSDYFRTRDTAAAAAADWNLEVELYDPRDLPALAAELVGSGGSHLVVGHSNTTPAMVGLLGGEPGPAINEATEYDRLYIVTIGTDGSTSSVMLRYGKPYEPQ
ncbi:MAG: histidine phosphatase family protein [Acidobacteria bacterium]|uniref:Histidine phosphatase family protein n=1 Tax=Candidatus Polarisedimenticola svalbardensis TaxID=2886004 RepID=A0A8J6XY68_9BACT|nr:histidine phosphatase family protein [Candidatus Polarisedimenticola svalbardensis]